MVFSSHLFIFYFLPLALLLYYAMPQRGRNLLLTLVSYVFYGWANPLFVAADAGLHDVRLRLRPRLSRTSSADEPWAATGAIADPGRRAHAGAEDRSDGDDHLEPEPARLLQVLQFRHRQLDGADRPRSACPSLGFDLAFKIILPLGISFYTFQSMSYAIDVYRGEARAIRNFVDFACFVAMFPQLVAGPIIRFADVAEQLQQRDAHADKLRARRRVLQPRPGEEGPAGQPVRQGRGHGLRRRLGAPASTPGTASSPTRSRSTSTSAATPTWRSASALMLGFVFAKNFDSPYRAQSITEFWRRWHISLSSWLRDYLYIPLGGNRQGARRTYLNLAIVMLLGGLWHGASWNFVIWGALHGGLLAFERAFGKRPLYFALPTPLRVGLTFVIVLFTWVFFRAKDLPAALAYCATMLGFGTHDSPDVAAVRHHCASRTIWEPSRCVRSSCGPARRRGIGRDASALARPR